ncbi:MAG: tetratricopeptide repeat protein, partial [Mucilaginibacter sp.]
MEKPQIAVDPECTNCTDRMPKAISKSVFWGLGVGIQQTAQSESLWHWGDNGDFKAFFIVFPATHESLVYFTHSNKGLFIAQQVVDLFMGKQTTWAIKWIEEGYDAPYAVNDFRAALLKQSFDHAAGVLNSLKQKQPGFNLSEHDLNELGYILMQQDKKAATAIFKFNISLHRNSSNAYESLAEAYEQTGDKALAIENFKRSLELDPKNEDAAQHLKKLEEGK